MAPIFSINLGKYLTKSGLSGHCGRTKENPYHKHWDVSHDSPATLHKLKAVQDRPIWKGVQGCSRKNGGKFYYLGMDGEERKDGWPPVLFQGWFTFNSAVFLWLPCERSFVPYRKILKNLEVTAFDQVWQSLRLSTALVISQLSYLDQVYIKTPPSSLAGFSRGLVWSAPVLSGRKSVCCVTGWCEGLTLTELGKSLFCLSLLTLFFK